MRIELPDQKKLVFQHTQPIRWGDMDAMGHVNNTVYFRYFETTRIEWFRHVDSNTNPLGVGPVILNAFCNFYKQLEYPGDIVTTLYVSDPARCTFETWLTIERVDQPGLIYAAGGATTVWVDFPKQKAVPLPEHIRELVSQ